MRTRVAAIERQLPSMPRSEVMAHYAIGLAFDAARLRSSDCAPTGRARRRGLAARAGAAARPGLVERYQQVQGEFSGWLSDDWIEDRLTRLREQVSGPGATAPRKWAGRAGQRVAAEPCPARAAPATSTRRLQLASQVIANESWRSEAKTLIGDVMPPRSSPASSQRPAPQALAA